jgi:hypothetical protein
VRNFSPRISQWNVWFGVDRPEASSVEVSKAHALGSRLREVPGPVLGIFCTWLMFTGSLTRQCIM